MTFTRKRIPSENIVLPPAIAMWAVTDPHNPEGYKGDTANRNWGLKLYWEGEARKEVEALLGPKALNALEVKREELLEEAGPDKLKQKKANEAEMELPWREEFSRETGEPTGRIEIVAKRPEYRTVRGERKLNTPPLVIDASKHPITTRVPNGATVVVKIASWPVYFAKDNRVGIKRLLEVVQVVKLPEARRPTADDMDAYDDGYTAEADEGTGDTGEGSRPVASGADY